ncbi:MAG TPA: response regulator, partial [Clostridia bacterium]|nr:response regulator [Clostridia bacterium]
PTSIDFAPQATPSQAFRLWPPGSAPVDPQARTQYSLFMGQYIKPGFRLLMVDDSEEDTFFVQTALQRSGAGQYFHAVSSVQEAINYMRGEGQFADRQKFPFPNALLVDLKMPGMDGFDLLRWLQQHPECKVIPTVVFSSSFLESDVHQVYVLGGNAFIAKPGSFEELLDLMQVTYNFWSRCQTPAPPSDEHCA